MTYIDLVNSIWGPCTDDEADALLWTCTAFPCIDREGLEKQLEKVKLESGGDFGLAMKQAEDAISKACGIQAMAEDIIEHNKKRAD